MINLFKSILEFIFINLQNLYSKHKSLLGIIVNKLQQDMQQVQQPVQQPTQPTSSVGSKKTLNTDITITANQFNKLTKNQRGTIINALRSSGLIKEYREHIQQLMPYMQKQIGFNRPPIINFVEDEQNAQNPLGKTGYYNPSTMEITVFVTGRHPKDIMRSVAHEMVHHAQNCRGDLSADKVGEAGEGDSAGEREEGGRGGPGQEGGGGGVVGTPQGGGR